MDRLDGCYINLNRSADRRERMEAELARVGASWVRRFPAIDARQIEVPPEWPLQPGAYACFRSHLAVIESADPGTFTLVLEDDVELSDDLFTTLHAQQLAALGNYDIVFLECQPRVDPDVYFPLWRSMMRQMRAYQPGADPHDRRLLGVELLNARDLYLWGATAYLVTPQGKGVVRRLLAENLTQRFNAIDMLFQRHIQLGELRAAVLVPFLATPRLAQPSTIEGRGLHEEPVLCDTLRRLLFAGPLGDLASYSAPVREAASGGDPALEILGDITPALLGIFR